MPDVAVIADPHFHDITHRPGGGTGPSAAVRTLADTMISTRVFNEGHTAFRTVLDDIVARGIKLVIIAGDLTDDGQAHTMRAAADLLRAYATRHGVRFFVTPGNHDLYAIHGRHQSKRFLNPDGTHTLVTSDSDAPQGDSVARIVTDEMYCGGYEPALRAMAPFGFFRTEADLHWESPFGADDRLESRTFEIRSADGGTTRRMIDASYLVEPVPGLWLLAIDANVFEPRNGDGDPSAERSYIDSTDAGWNSMVRNKPFVLRWMHDVARRAGQEGKRLLTFSHYPMIAPTAGTTEDEVRLFGETSFVRRLPSAATTAAALATGIKVHVSGHLHLNDTALSRQDDGFLVNISVPSLVAFPPAYKVVTHEGGRLVVESVPVVTVPDFETAFDLYRTEARLTRASCGAALDARSHADFLNRHLAHLVTHRHLPREWPEELIRLAPTLSLADLWRLGDADRSAADSAPPVSGDIRFIDLIEDWYRLRHGRDLAFDAIAPERIAAYRRLAARYAARAWETGGLQYRIAALLRMLVAYAAGQPSRDFSVDLVTGALKDIFPAK
jgi:3',5'-cyclic AMP phosphodiesterase CpdA